MKVLFAAAEFAPFVRTGGLGNAVSGLASALAARGHSVTAAIPAYRLVREQGKLIAGGPWRVLEHEGVTVMMYDDLSSFDRDGVYGPTPGTSFPDNWQRYGRFSAAVGELAASFHLLHLHDAHTGPAALVANVPSVFTVHNAAHPILAPLGPAVQLLGLGSDAVVPGSPLEWYGEANYLKAGMAGATQVTTVSKGHAAELAVDATAFGLGGVVRSLKRPIRGILNGIEADSWDPTKDAILPAPFAASKLEGRASSRAALLAKARLDDGIVFGNVGRMARQKGLGLLEPGLDELIAEGLRLVLVGNGELDTLVDDWVAKYPTAIAHLPYDESLARLVSAGADAYLMPSEFEPCGLGQMYSMRYGAPPVVRLTGGLADSVLDIDEYPETGTGFGFRSFEPMSLIKTIRRAMRYRAGFPKLWEKIQRNGMTTDFSWSARAADYEELYESVVG
jgi:starch synthase